MLPEEKITPVCCRALNKYGPDLQLNIAIEEASELIEQLGNIIGDDIISYRARRIREDARKYRNKEKEHPKNCNSLTYQEARALAGEIADAHIMLRQLEKMYSITGIVNEETCKKLHRLDERLHDKQEEKL